MTFEEYSGPGRILLSYDVRGSERSAAARVCQIVFGRSGSIPPENGERREEGFTWRPGVVWIGQSVLILPPRDADELAAKLRRLGVRVSVAPVVIDAAGLASFRRPR